MSIIHRMEQRTEPWFAVRTGIPTASNFDRIITPAGKPSAQRRKYLYQLVAERLLKRPFGAAASTPAMLEGIAREPAARARFASTQHMELEVVGFITTDDGKLGCSPDAIIKGRSEGLEIKCPTPPVHVGYMLDGPEEAYRAQVQGQMLIAELDRVHFYSYSTELPPVHKIATRDETYIGTLRALLYEFADELDAETIRAERMSEEWWRNFQPGDEPAPGG